MKITKRQLRQIIQEATVSIDVPSWSHLSEQIDDITETLNNLAGMYNDVPQSWLLTGKNEKNVISGQIAEALEQLYWDSEKLGGVISNKLAMESRTRMGEGADYDKRQLRQIIRESIEVMNSDTGELLYLPDSYADRYEDGQEVPDREFGPLYDEVSAATPEGEDTLFDPEEALEELRATAQTLGGSWVLDNPGRSLDDVAYDLASSIKLSVSEKTWESALEIFDYDEEELIWSLAEAMV